MRILRQTPKVCVENEKIPLPKGRRAKNDKIRSKRLDEYAKNQPKIPPSRKMH
jgi:hypothetical protein